MQMWEVTQSIYSIIVDYKSTNLGLFGPYLSIFVCYFIFLVYYISDVNTAYCLFNYSLYCYKLIKKKWTSRVRNKTMIT